MHMKAGRSSTRPSATPSWRPPRSATARTSTPKTDYNKKKKTNNKKKHTTNNYNNMAIITSHITIMFIDMFTFMLCLHVD